MTEQVQSVALRTKIVVTVAIATLICVCFRELDVPLDSGGILAVTAITGVVVVGLAALINYIRKRKVSA